MTRNPSEPGLEIYSKDWFDNIFADTRYNHPEYTWLREAAERIVHDWQLGSSSDPILVANTIYNEYTRMLHATIRPGV